MAISESKGKVNKLALRLVLNTFVPILLLGLTLAFAGIGTIKYIHNKNTNAMLMGVCKQIRQDYNDRFSDIITFAEGKYYVADEDISDFKFYLDSYKTNFGCEVSIFIGNTQTLTSIKGSVNGKAIGVVLDDNDLNQAIQKGRDYTSSKILLGGRYYYACFTPLFNHGIVTGFIFAGVPYESNRNEVKNFTTIILGVFSLLLAASVYLSALSAKRIGGALSQIKDYLGLLVLRQTPDVSMSDKVLSRKDEIGDLARYSVDAGNQLKQIIGRDTLTGLYNRRTGRQFLDMMWDNARVNFTSLAIVMCDIDFFKKVNDTYGHDVGDVVLKRIGAIINSYINETPNAFAIRWGGEEFLMGFLLSGPQTLKIIESLRTTIKDQEFITEGDEKFKITMTFGLVTASSAEEISSVISRADAKLYEGKHNGRDQIVYK